MLPEDIERIEVISGPGATLWGSNAVNGVINIITRPSSQTQGGVLTLGAGNIERDVSLQYGGRLGPDLTYRVHGEFSDFSSYPQSNGQSANDAWSRPGGGFRIDWTPANDQLSVQGDLSTETEQPDGFNRSNDVAASWHHKFDDGSSLQLLSYFDNDGRYANNGAGFTLYTYDFELQHNFTVAGWNNIVWGVGERAFRYMFENTALQLVPPRQTLNLADAFVQDTISLPYQVKLTLGFKLEDEPYAGFQPMPSIRVAWKPVDTSAALGGGLPRGALAHPGRYEYPRISRPDRFSERINRLPAGDPDGIRDRHPRAGVVAGIVLDFGLSRRV